jgi:hypothetical protein
MHRGADVVQNPGNVSSAERVPPPTVGSASMRVVCRPAFARTMAAVKPFGPEPMTTALCWRTITALDFA